MKSGLTSRYFPTLLQQYSALWQAYQDLRSDLYEHFSLEGPVEEMLVDKIVVETIRFNRLLSKERTPRSWKPWCIGKFCGWAPATHPPLTSNFSKT